VSVREVSSKRNKRVRTAPRAAVATPLAEPRIVRDGVDELTIIADKQLTLRCGESSITLTAAGKIIIRGKYIVSRSSGVQRIKGGSVQIN